MAAAAAAREFVVLKHTQTNKKIKFVSKNEIADLTHAKVVDFLVKAAQITEPLDVYTADMALKLAPTGTLRDLGVQSGDTLLLVPQQQESAGAAAAVAASPIVVAAAPAVTAAKPSVVPAAPPQAPAPAPPVAKAVAAAPAAAASPSSPSVSPAQQQQPPAAVASAASPAKPATLAAASSAAPSGPLLALYPQAEALKAEYSRIARRLLVSPSGEPSRTLPVLEAAVFDPAARCFALHSMQNSLKTGETRNVAEHDGPAAARACGRVCDPRNISEHALWSDPQQQQQQGARMLVAGPPASGKSTFALKSCLEQPFLDRPAVYLPLSYLFSSRHDLPSPDGSSSNVRSFKDAACRFLQDVNACDNEQWRLGALLGPLCDPARAFPVVWLLDDLDILLNKDDSVLDRILPPPAANSNSNNNGGGQGKKTGGRADDDDDDRRVPVFKNNARAGGNNNNSSVIKSFDAIIFFSRDGFHRERLFTRFAGGHKEFTEWRLFRWSASDEHRFCWNAVGGAACPNVLSLTRAVLDAFEQHQQLGSLRGCPLTTKVMTHLAARGADLQNIKSLSEAFDLLVRVEIGSAAADTAAATPAASSGAAAAAAKQMIAQAGSVVNAAALRLVREQVPHEAAFALTPELEASPWLARLVDAGLLCIVGRSDGEKQLDAANAQSSRDGHHRGPRVVFRNRAVTELFAHMHLFRGSEQPKDWDWDLLRWDRADRQLWTLIAGRVASRAAQGNPKETFAFRAATCFFLFYSKYRGREGAESVHDMAQCVRHRVNVFAALAVELSHCLGAHLLIDEIIKQHGMFLQAPSHLRWMVPLCGRFGAHDTLRFLLSKIAGGAKMLSAQEMADLYTEAVIGGQRPAFFHQLQRIVDISLDMNTAAEFGAVSPLVFAIDDARRTNQNKSPVFLRRVYRCLDQAVRRSDSEIKAALLAALPLTDAFLREHELVCQEALACLTARMALWRQYMVHWQPHPAMMWEDMFSMDDAGLVAQFFDGVGFNQSVGGIMALAGASTMPRSSAAAGSTASASEAAIALRERFITRCGPGAAAEHFLTRVTLLEGHPMVGKTTFGIRLCLLQPFPDHCCIYFDVRSLQALRKNAAREQQQQLQQQQQKQQQQQPSQKGKQNVGGNEDDAAAAAGQLGSSSDVSVPSTLAQLWELLNPPIDPRAPVMWIFDNIDRLPKDVEFAFGQIMMELATARGDAPVFVDEALLSAADGVSHGAHQSSGEHLHHSASAPSASSSSSVSPANPRRHDRCILLSRVMRGGCPFLAKSAVRTKLRTWVLPHRTDAQERLVVRNYLARAGHFVQGLQDPAVIDAKTAQVMGHLRRTRAANGTATNIRGVRLLLKWICRLTVFAHNFDVPDMSDPLVVIEAEMRRRCAVAGLLDPAEQEDVISVACVCALRAFVGGFPFYLTEQQPDAAAAAADAVGGSQQNKNAAEQYKNNNNAAPAAADPAAAASASYAASPQDVERMLRCGFVHPVSDQRLLEGYEFKASEVELFAALSLRRGHSDDHLSLLHWSAAFELLWKLAGASLSHEEFHRLSWNAISHALYIDPDALDEEERRQTQQQQLLMKQLAKAPGSSSSAAAASPPMHTNYSAQSLDEQQPFSPSSPSVLMTTSPTGPGGGMSPFQYQQQLDAIARGVPIIPFFLALELSDQQPSVLFRTRLLGRGLRRKLDLSAPCGVFGSLEVLREHLSHIRGPAIFENVKLAALRKACEYYSAEQAAEYVAALSGVTSSSGRLAILYPHLLASAAAASAGGALPPGDDDLEQDESSAFLSDANSISMNFSFAPAGAPSASAAAAAAVAAVAAAAVASSASFMASPSPSQLFGGSGGLARAPASQFNLGAAAAAAAAVSASASPNARGAGGNNTTTAIGGAGSHAPAQHNPGSSTNNTLTNPLAPLLARTFSMSKKGTSLFSGTNDRFVRLELVWDDSARRNAYQLVWSEDAAGKKGRKKEPMSTLRDVQVHAEEQWCFSLVFGESRDVYLYAKSAADFELWTGACRRFVELGFGARRP